VCEISHTLNTIQCVQFQHIENYDLQEAFLPKLTYSSQGNNALDAAAYNIDGFLGR
jgi:hypothetical protein